MDNPFAPNCSDPAKPRQPQSEETWTGFVLLAIMIALACYGAVRLMKDTGVVFHDSQGEAHFWFEPQLREWIHR